MGIDLGRVGNRHTIATRRPEPAPLRTSRPEADVVTELRENVAEFGRQHGLFRTGMDYLRPPDDPADLTARLDDKESAVAFFDERLLGAERFLADRGQQGRVVAKMVTADIVNLLGQRPVQHVEWQLFLIPEDPPGPRDPGTLGLLDEAKLEAWLAVEGVTRGAQPFLRSEDNPLFLGRLNYGTAGAGLYVRVPEYAERGGTRYDTRTVKSLAVTSADKARGAIQAMYDRLPGDYGVNGVCHQGAVVVAEALGLDPVRDAAQLVGGLWASRLRYGRSGR